MRLALLHFIFLLFGSQAEAASSFCNYALSDQGYLIAPLFEIKKIDFSQLKTTAVEWIRYFDDAAGEEKTEVIKAKLVVPDDLTAMGKYAKQLQTNGKEVLVFISDAPAGAHGALDGAFLKVGIWRIENESSMQKNRLIFLHTDTNRGKLFMVIRSHETFHAYSEIGRALGLPARYYDSKFTSTGSRPLPFLSNSYKNLLSVEELHTYVKDLIYQSFRNHHRDTLKMITAINKNNGPKKISFASVIDDESYQSTFAVLNAINKAQLSMSKSILTRFENESPSLNVLLQNEKGEIANTWQIQIPGLQYEIRSVAPEVVADIQNDMNQISGWMNSSAADEEKTHDFIVATEEKIESYLRQRVRTLADKNMQVRSELLNLDSIVKRARKKGYFSFKDYADLKNTTARLGVSVQPN